MTTHMGRSFTDHRLEDQCPCPKAPCGLVDMEHVSPDCEMGHRISDARTIRQSHSADDCPARPDFLNANEWAMLLRASAGQQVVGPVALRLIERRMIRPIDHPTFEVQVTEYGLQVIHARLHAERSRQQ